jgi:hypothetical protein
MKFLNILLIFFLINNCSKPKTVLICGDHICVNKTEAEQYFEENLSIEVKIIHKKNKKKIDLVELNLKDDLKDNRKISIEEKNKTNKIVKVLTIDEIKKIKEEIKEKKMNKVTLGRASKDKSKKNDNTKIVKKTDVISNNNDEKSIIKKDKVFRENIKKKTKINTNKLKVNEVDVCTIIEKCSIDEISKYLLKQGKKKSFPNITSRE